jgi:hypothetical protein
MSSTIPDEIMAKLEKAAKRAALGIRDPAAAKLACERMDRMREKLRAKYGEMNIAVDLIREIRDGE